MARPFVRRTLLTGVLAAAFAASVTMTAHGQGRRDIVTLANGDRITGEVKRLQRGRLEFKTDDAGTLYLEWDKLASVVATRLFEITASDGRRFLGALGRAPSRSLSLVAPSGEIHLPMSEVTGILPIGTTFWRKLDGSFDAGFTYTQSSGVAQLNVNSDTIYRRPAFHARLRASFTATSTETDDGTERDDRSAIEAAYQRDLWRRWFISGAARVERNESLGIELRTQGGGAMGPRLINSNRAQLDVGAGVVVNDERGVDVESTKNVEALLVFRTSFYTYDWPTTNLDISLQYYPSLSNAGRHRLQADAGIKQEVFKDLSVTLSLYNSFDSRPPTASANSNDVGLVLSIGWTY